MQVSSSLASKHCTSCEDNAKHLSKNEYEPLLRELSGWETLTGKQIKKEWTFSNFAEAVAFINRIASLAESEQHHPDIYLHDYKHVRITLFTHAANGLSENDFILAAKID